MQPGEADRRAVGRRRGRLPGRQLPAALVGVERQVPRHRARLLARRAGDAAASSRYRFTGSSDLYEARRPPPARQHQLRHRPRRLHAARPRLVQREAQRGQRRGQPRRRERTTARGTAASRGRPTTRRSSRCARRQQRNFLATLLLSQGVPMLLGGDELGRTQQGNNNAYCQDNEIVLVRLGARRRRPARVHPRADRRCARQHPVLPPPRAGSRAAPIHGDAPPTSPGSGPTATQMTDEDWKPRLAQALGRVPERRRDRRTATRAASAIARRQLPAAVQRAPRAGRLHAARRAVRAAPGACVVDTAVDRRGRAATAHDGRTRARWPTGTRACWCCARGRDASMSRAAAAHLPRPARTPGFTLRRPRPPSCRLPRRARRQPPLPLAVPAGRAGQHARLRRRRSPRGRTTSSAARPASRAAARRARARTGSASAARHRPQPHGDRAPTNRWWWDVLENGPASRYAGYFDVDWEPPEAQLRNTRAAARSSATTTAACSRPASCGSRRDGGCVRASATTTTRFPLAPRSLDDAAARRARDALRLRRAGVPRRRARRGCPRATATDRASVERAPPRQGACCAALARSAAARAARVARRRRRRRSARSNADPDALDALLERQNYRLAFWRDGAQRARLPALLRHRHAGRPARRGPPRVRRRRTRSSCELARARHGRRPAHRPRRRPARPARLPRAAAPTPAPAPWIVVEKILGRGEALPRRWPVDGTTGYDFLIGARPACSSIPTGEARARPTLYTRVHRRRARAGATPRARRRRQRVLRRAARRRPRRG